MVGMGRKMNGFATGLKQEPPTYALYVSGSWFERKPNTSQDTQQALGRFILDLPSLKLGFSEPA
jgi:hypothetical protein